MTNEQFATNKADALRQRLERQLLIIKKRCESLTTKASETQSLNSDVRLAIDDLRKERILHHDHVHKMKIKARGDSTTLLKVIKNPFSQHLPAGSGFCAEGSTSTSVPAARLAVVTR